VLDEPTNHLDLESIEALVAGLQNYEGTLILVSHDRWFVNQLATRVVEISRTGIRDYHGTYEEYVHDCGDDHLDADSVVLKTKRTEKKARRDGGTERPAQDSARASGGNGRGGRTRSDGATAQRQDERLAGITADIEAAESAIAALDASFAAPGYFDNTPGDRVQAAQAERRRLQEKVERLLEEWERLEQESQAAV
jgi:ATPase subunit of ABC transporter with duplicated ATPase domains